MEVTVGYGKGDCDNFVELMSVMETGFLPCRCRDKSLGGDGSCKCALKTSTHVGSTAVVAVVSSNHLVVSNCGDSRAVLSRRGNAVPLSSDHRPDRADELKRIQDAGGKVIYWDVVSNSTTCEVVRMCLRSSSTTLEARKGVGKAFITAFRSGAVIKKVSTRNPLLRFAQRTTVISLSVDLTLLVNKKMKSLPSYAFRAPIKFRMPTSENLVPIRLDIQVDGQRFKDAFTWNPTDPDSEVTIFAKRTVKDLKLPPTFISPITQSIQTQLSEFCSFQGQDMHAREKILPIKLDLCVNSTVVRDQFLWDLGNFDSDPEDFAKTFCDDMNITDPQVGPAIAVSIREQLYEMAIQNVAFAREYRIGKKSRRGFDPFVNSKASNNALDLAKFFGSKGSAIRKRKEWDLYDPIVDILTNEEVVALDARDRNSRPI